MKEKETTSNMENRTDEQPVLSPRSYFVRLKDFLYGVLDLKHNTDLEATNNLILEGISMKGHTAWILIFSILIASIGLNVSSTAVVIGAMLISPLLGPILGIGYSLAINDMETLKKSLTNFAIMIALGLITSFVFFSFPIFRDATPELLARTKPDVRDVLIAFIGGLALIIAISRPTPQFNTVAGVAIATALMPPLCTAGFGLATGKMNYFGGAMFLFTINSIFIAFATFTISKYLNFPMKQYQNEARRRRISQVASALAFVIFAFSIYSFYELWKQNQYKSRANDFLNELRREGVNIIKDNNESIDYENKKIELYVFGESYSEKDISRWEQMLEQKSLQDTQLMVYQGQANTGLMQDMDEIISLYTSSYKLLTEKEDSLVSKDQRINELEGLIKKHYNAEILFGQITDEIKINYADLEQLGYAKEYVTNFDKVDTLNVFFVKWAPNKKKEDMRQSEEKLKLWMEARLNVRPIEIRRYQ
ncbi:MAG: DUF389 domain-containing protein [Flavobacteriaceae bacterium]|nr:DUF389 domain-containing protein [Flavobacteriaceae bacterium]